MRKYPLPLQNYDWEDLSQDNSYFYLGAFGNNTGKKDSLQIFRIDKQSLLRQKPVIDTIAFTWPQTLNHGKLKKINFDCEAMVVLHDSIFLFTKEWKKSRCTRVFGLPARPGNYIAQYKSTLKTRVLVSGASYNNAIKQLVLCGYNLFGSPILLVFPDVNGSDFFAGKGRRLRIKKTLLQIEGITTFDGKKYFIINEDARFIFLHTKPQMHSINLDK